MWVTVTAAPFGDSSSSSAIAKTGKCLALQTNAQPCHAGSISGWCSSLALCSVQQQRQQAAPRAAPPSCAAHLPNDELQLQHLLVQRLPLLLLLKQLALHLGRLAGHLGGRVWHGCQARRIRIVV